MNISKETFNFFHAYRNMVNAELYLTAIINSGNVKSQAKQFTKMLRTRIEANINALKTLLPPEAYKVMEEQMLDSEVTLQIQAISDMCAELPKPIRDMVEKYIEGQHKVYKQKVA